MPGDPTREELVESMIRVDHAGEYGAARIYDGADEVHKTALAKRILKTYA